MFPPNDHIFKPGHEREVLGQKLALARLKTGLTQMQAMQQAGLISEKGGHPVGVSKGFLTYTEAGRRGITKDQLKALAKLYGIPVKTLLDPTPLPENELRILKRLLEASRRGGKVTQTTRRTMSAETPNRKVVAISKAKTKAKPAAKPTPAKVTKPASKKVATKRQVNPFHPNHASAAPAMSPADRKMLDLTRGMTEDQKDWCANALKAVIDKARRPAPALAAR